MNQQAPATPPTSERVQAAIDSARAAVERTRAMIERTRAILSGAEHALAEAEATTATMNEVRRGAQPLAELRDAA